MADSDGEYIDLSDDDAGDHQISDHEGGGGAAGGAAGGPAGAAGSRHHRHGRHRRRSRAGDGMPIGGGGGGGAGGGGGGGGGNRRRRRSGAGEGRGGRGGGRGLAAWEDIQRSWDAVVEGADGSLAVTGLLEASKRARLLRDTTPLQRGIIRHLVLVLDMSFAMAEKDLLPTRYALTLATARAFVREYFEQNPISQLAVVGMRDGVAVRVSDLSGDPAEHLDRLRGWDAKDPGGNPSLQNALEMCRGALFHAPSHGTREVLIIYGALLSSDPGDIHDTIAALVADRIRVSVVGLSAQVAICAELCARTNSALALSSAAASAAAGAGSGKALLNYSSASGTDAYTVALHESHFRDLVLAATTPPVTHSHQQAADADANGTAAANTSEAASLLMMGFPSRSVAVAFDAVAPSAAAAATSSSAQPPPQSTRPPPAAISLCACHNTPLREGYSCTRCATRVCRLPSDCPACGLTLVLSTHLARSYHHLFPLRNWVEVSWRAARAAADGADGARRQTACFACLTPFPKPPPDKDGQPLGQAQGQGQGQGGDRGKGKEKPREGSPKQQNAAERGGSKQQQQQHGGAGGGGGPGHHRSRSHGGRRHGSRTAAALPALATPQLAKGLSESGRYACEVCGCHFCIDCDVYAHEVMHNCPGCQAGIVLGPGVVVPVDGRVGDGADDEMDLDTSQRHHQMNVLNGGAEDTGERLSSQMDLDG